MNQSQGLLQDIKECIGMTSINSAPANEEQPDECWPVFSEPTAEDLALVTQSGLFDEKWYRANYLLGRAEVMPPLIHFMRYGLRKGYKPNPHFDPRQYLAENPEALHSGINPLLHYCMFMSVFNSQLASNQNGRVSEAALESIWSQTRNVIVGDISLKFHRINAVTTYRIDSFFEKEPETIEWLNTFIDNAVFWDVGANIGLYSIYAQKMRHAKVYAFEPSVFNLELLARHAAINTCQQTDNKISIIPMCLSDSTKFGEFELSYMTHGEACSTFAEGYDQHGNTLQKCFEYTMPGITADALVELYGLEIPDYIKIDVDGTEHLILAGMKKLLASPKVKSVLVETSFDFNEHASMINAILDNSGFTLAVRAHADFYDTSPYRNTYNCIWTR
ncbi:MAG: FkbM family methyltransferase [Desulfovibrio sp.]|uniref:FkbM family methyltransferase n=1 Tax=Desulfovibrio sp. TaxID=885 RepID=UPI0039E54C0D